MTNSREKFEAWAVYEKGGDTIKDDDGNYLFPETEVWYEGWLAGRESMRDEAAQLVEDRAFIAMEFIPESCTSPQEVSDRECHEAAAQIKEIQP